MRSSFLLRGVRRLSGFGASTVVTGLIGLLVIPIIVATAGREAWSAVAVGTACGSVGAVLSGFGWSVTGPGSVAVLSNHERRAYFNASFSARSLLAVIAVPLSGSVSWLLSPRVHAVEAVLIAVSTTVLGLGASWYFIGAGAPGRLFLADTLPRSLANLSGAVLMLLGLGLLSYALAQLAGALLTVLLGRALVGRSDSAPPRVLFPGLQVYRVQLAGFATGAVASVYQALPTLVIASAAPSAVASYALADRLLKLANSAQAPFSQTLQSWVPSGGRELLLHRARRATAIAVLVGAGSGLGLFLLAPTLGRVMGAGAIVLSTEIALPLGVALMMTIISQCAGIACLVALGRPSTVAGAALAGALSAAAILWALAAPLGAVGAMWSVAGAELVVVVIECTILLVLTRSERTTGKQRPPCSDDTTAPSLGSSPRR